LFNLQNAPHRFPKFFQKNRWGPADSSQAPAYPLDNADTARRVAADQPLTIDKAAPLVVTDVSHRGEASTRRGAACDA